MLEHKESLRVALIGAAVVAASFVVLRVTGVLTAQEVFQPAGAPSGAQILYWVVMLSFAGFILLLSWRLGTRWASRRGAAALIGTMAAGVHVLTWCAIGILVGVESATGSMSEFAWIANLLVLAVSALVVVGALISILRSSAV
ncbi:hypothetical protein ASF21_16110 [Arthrobacter sp. Leaf234]|uniref:hypothetical protein n=1 Tax=Arthrobacter sp. Leaf234 TaxID=1736303 RepID=UPI0006F4CF4E|nr:hypothetical protein [Arthrobacter sp. Leaf234]KQO02147.1 hypothetical protein ASF21_16110 [Arthrobacter sp. Leaf234]